MVLVCHVLRGSVCGVCSVNGEELKYVIADGLTGMEDRKGLCVMVRSVMMGWVRTTVYGGVRVLVICGRRKELKETRK